MSESLYGAISRIPIVGNIANVFIMHTFFNQFLGGETTAECIPKIQALRQRQMGTLLGYNIEAELDGSSKDPKVIAIQTQHVLDSISAQGQLARQLSPESVPGNDNRFWVRIKLTGLLPRPIALAHGSNAIIRARAPQALDKDVPYPGLPHDGDWDAAITGEGVTESDRQDLLSLRSTMEKIASEARKNNVRVVIDAEQSWYQPVIDSLTDELLQKYNSLNGPPTCIASFQAYLRRYPQLLDQQIRRAEEKGYTLLFKQVRGAYMVSEAERWKKENGDSESPVWATKSQTDASFNYGVEKAISTIASQIQETGSAKLGAVFATHNSFSVDLGFKLLEKSGLAKRISGSGKLLVSREAAKSIAFAQLYGKLSKEVSSDIGISVNSSKTDASFQA